MLGVLYTVTKFHAGTILTSQDMDSQAHAIYKTPFAELVTYTYLPGEFVKRGIRNCGITCHN